MKAKYFCEKCGYEYDTAERTRNSRKVSICEVRR